ncbi:hypothetical protein L7F22_046622 [Adiantum nelumboides]|nr:hypothetical protein [Adiantum nelumboides]
MACQMTIVYDRDPKFTSLFWKAIWENIGTRLQFSSSFHPQTDGQSKIANSVVLDLLKSYISDQKTQWERTPIGQGYGLTETCAGASFSEWDDTTVGRVGPPIPHCYLKLINWEEGGYKITDSPMPRGEIIIGGPSVTLGYFKNEAKTEEVYKVDETGMRWFYTGDIGQFHPDGCLEIIDRKKDIVKLQHGEYVSLGKVEAALAVSPYVDNVMIHADPFHSYVVAILVASQHALESFAQSKGIEYKSFENLCEKDEAVKEVLASLQKVGKGARLERFEIPAKIKLLSEPWTPESNLVTAALKLKRENLRKEFADELKKLYS